MADLAEERDLPVARCSWLGQRLVREGAAAGTERAEQLSGSPGRGDSLDSGGSVRSGLAPTLDCRGRWEVMCGPIGS
jgi:hypothetical protein